MFLTMPTDMELAHLLIKDLQADFEARFTRLKELAELEVPSSSKGGKLLFGGAASLLAYTEVRSSFVFGHFAATVLLSQMLLEHLLASVAGMMGEQLGKKPEFKKTLATCQKRGLLTTIEVTDIGRLISIRNPLMHYRDTEDADHLMRRGIREGRETSDLCEDDARFAIGLITRLLGKSPFAVG